MEPRVEGVVTLLQVFDMPSSVRFYRDVLGFEIAETSRPRDGDEFDWGLLRRDGVELMLNTAYEGPDRPPAPDPARIAGHADTCLFFACRDLDRLYESVRSRGVRVDRPVVRDYGMKQLSLKDPDGYGLCFQWEAGE